MSFENPQSERPEPSFEAKNTALANEWPRIMTLAGEPSDLNGIHGIDYGVDEGYSNRSEAKGIEGVLERLARSGVTPENHEVAAAMKKVIDTEAHLDALRAEQAASGYSSERAMQIIDLKPEALQEIEDAKEALKDAIAKHQPAVTGGY
jgi:hypothetical protein